MPEPFWDALRDRTSSSQCRPSGARARAGGGGGGGGGAGVFPYCCCSAAPPPPHTHAHTTTTNTHEQGGSGARTLRLAPVLHKLPELFDAGLGVQLAEAWLAGSGPEGESGGGAAAVLRAQVCAGGRGGVARGSAGLHTAPAGRRDRCRQRRGRQGGSGAPRLEKGGARGEALQAVRDVPRVGGQRLRGRRVAARAGRRGRGGGGQGDGDTLVVVGRACGRGRGRGEGQATEQSGGGRRGGGGAACKARTLLHPGPTRACPAAPSPWRLGVASPHLPSAPTGRQRSFWEGGGVRGAAVPRCFESTTRHALRRPPAGLRCSRGEACQAPDKLYCHPPTPPPLAQQLRRHPRQAPQRRQVVTQAAPQHFGGVQQQLKTREGVAGDGVGVRGGNGGRGRRVAGK